MSEDSNQNIHKNYLLDILNYELIPYDKIKNEDYLPAFQKSIEIINEEFSKIVSKTTPLNLSDFEKSTFLFDQIKSIYNNKRRSDSLDEDNLHKEEIDKLINETELSIYTNKSLFNKFKELKEDDFKTKEEKYVYKFHMRKFLENGMLISDDEEKLQKLKQLKIKIASLISKYETNLIKDTNKFELNIINEEDMKEFPESIKIIAKKCSKEKGYESGYCFTLKYPSYSPFMMYCSNRELRKKMYYAYNSKCFGGENSNIEIMSEIVELRQEMAHILGFKNYNEYILSNRMAKNEDNVNNFHKSIIEKALPKAKKEYNNLLNFAREYEKENNGNEIEILELWDVSYYSDKLKKKLYNIDSEELRKYFPLNKVFEKLFNLIYDLFEIKIEKEEKIKLFHNDIITFSMWYKDNKIGYFYFDLFPRNEKTMGGWVYSLKPKIINKLPIVGVNANIRKSITNKIEDTLLSLYEAETIFHETGHSLHIILSETNYKSITGINVLWDFLEMPSQLMEEFFMEEEMLKQFDIPQDIIEKILKLKNFNIGIGTIRQIEFSLIDIKLHSGIFKKGDNIEEFEKKYGISVFKKPEGTCIFCAFSHIFNATYDYSCGYYSYMWAEVLALDGYDEFAKNKDKKEVAERYRKWILSKGGSDDPEELFRQFKGRDFSIEPFLKKKGFIE